MRFEDAIDRVVGALSTGDGLVVRQVSDELLRGYRGERLVRAEAARAVFVGDLHGDLDSLLAVYRRYFRGPDLLVFLGDYVDRGPFQLEVLVGVLLMHRWDPRRVVTLRGNHESVSMNRYYGFLSHLRRRLGGAWRPVYELLAIRAYRAMPVAALVDLGYRVFAVHGGIPIDAPSLDQIERLPAQEEPRDPVLVELLWNDPGDCEYYAPSLRGVGAVFGRRVVERFMRRNGVDLVVRAHEPVNGVGVSLGGRVVTVFTCRYYGIRPAVLELERGEKPRLRVVYL